jgi:ATP-dependent RNA helicase DDX55/SPB4
VPETKSKRDRTDADDEGDDWEELAREEKMAKKMRKGDISREAFDEEFLSL